MIKRLTIGAALVVAVLLSGASWESKAEAAPLCTPSAFVAGYSSGVSITFSIGTSCPTRVNTFEYFATNCGSVGGSVQGTSVLPNSSCNLATLVTCHSGNCNTTGTTTRKACGNTIFQTTWLNGFNWMENWNAVNGVGGGWHGPYGVNWVASDNNNAYVDMYCTF